METRPKIHPLVAVVLVGALLLAGCGGSAAAGESAGENAAPAPGGGDDGTTTSAAPGEAPRAPLTGLPVADGSLLDRPAVVVKIDNDAAARPQAGLNEADLVYEVMVEGITRFAAVYHTGASERVGPVRSARTSDRDLLTNLNRPLFAWSGGNPTVAGEVRRHAAEGKLVDLSEDAFQEAYRREGPNPRPHNLYTSTAAIRGRTPGDAGPPDSVFSFRTDGEPLPDTAVPTGGVRVDYGSARMPEVDFVWDQEAGGWRRYQVDTGHDIVQSAHVDAGGRQVAPTNVVILSVDYTPSPADGESPQAITVDSGEAVVLSEGQMVTGRWHRPNNEVGYELTDADGAEIGLAPGTTWVLLPEAGATQPLTPAESRGLLAHRR